MLFSGRLLKCLDRSEVGREQRETLMSAPESLTPTITQAKERGGKSDYDSSKNPTQQSRSGLVLAHAFPNLQ